MAKDITRRLNIYINGKAVRNTLNGVGKEVRVLRGQIGNLTRGTAEYNRKSAELKKVSKVYRSIKREVTGIPSLFDRLTKSAGAFVTAFGFGFGLQRIVGGFRNLSAEFAVLSDAQADVQKTTGLTKQQVEGLTKTLDKIKTRSSRLELLGLAEEAGRLGKESVQDIEDFVRVADKIKVALGDDLGGDVNANIRIIGKLAEQYEVAERNGVGFGDSLELLGSAINEVSASGSAQAGFLVDYLARVSGVSKQVNIAAQDQIGFAAALDEAGQSVEVSGTTVNKILVDLYSNTDKYAEIAGKSTQDFAKILKTDANEAFLLFLEGLDKNGEGLQSMVGHFEDLGIGSTRNISVITSLAGNIDKIREKQDLANISLQEGTSLTDEFNAKNTTLGALLERIQNRFTQIYQDGGIKNFLTEVALWFARLIGAIEDGDGSVKRFWKNIVTLSKIFGVAITAIISYKAALKLAALWENRLGILMKLNQLVLRINILRLRSAAGAALLFKAAKLALTGQIKKARIAMIAFNSATKLSPLGLLVGVIAAASAAYVVFKKRTKEVNQTQKQINDLNNAAGKSIAGQRAELDTLLITARNEAASKEKRIAAIKKLNELSPEYLGHLNLENINTFNVKKSTDEYIESLKKVALEKALASKREALYADLYAAENSSLEDNISLTEKITSVLINGAHAGLENNRKAAQNRKDTIADIKKQLVDLDNYQKEIDSKSNEGTTTTTTTTVKPNNELTDEQKSILKKQKAFRDKVLFESKSGFEKEKTLQQQRLKDAGIFGKSREKLTKDELSVLESLEATHKANLAKIDAKATSDFFAGKKKSHEKDIQLLKTNQANELASITSLAQAKNILKGKIGEEELAKIETLEQAKKALKEHHQLKELEQQQVFLTEVIRNLENAMNGEAVEGLSLGDTLLTEEERVVLEERLGAINLLLAEIGVKKNAITNIDEEGESKNPDLDILGFNPAQWKATFENKDTLVGKLERTAMVLDSVGQAWNLYSQFAAAAEQKQLKNLEKTTKRKKELLKDQFDRGLINQEEYNSKIGKLDDDLAKKQAEIDYKRAKRERISALFGVAINTSIGIAKAVAAAPLSGGLPWSAIIGAIGALQAGIILTQPLPSKSSYADGGFTSGLGFRDSTGEQVAGVVHADEYVIPRAVLQSNDPAVPAVVQYLEARRQNQATPFVDGGETSPGAIPEASQDNSMMEAMLQQMTRFNDLLENGIETGPILIGDQQIQDFDSRKDDLKSVRNQAKVA